MFLSFWFTVSLYGWCLIYFVLESSLKDWEKSMLKPSSGRRTVSVQPIDTVFMSARLHRKRRVSSPDSRNKIHLVWDFLIREICVGFENLVTLGGWGLRGWIFFFKSESAIFWYRLNREYAKRNGRLLPEIMGNDTWQVEDDRKEKPTD